MTDAPIFTRLTGASPSKPRIGAAARVAACVMVCVLLACAVLAPAQAQDAAAEPTLEQQIAGWDQTAAGVESALEAGQINVDALDRLRSVMEQQRLEARALVERLEQDLAPLRGQLEALGATPEEGVEEAPELTERRAALTERITRLDARRSEALLVATRATDLQDRLARVSRAVLAKQILRQGPSVIDVSLWSDGPRELIDLGGEIAGGAAAAVEKLEPFGAHAVGVSALAALCIALIAALRARRRFHARLVGAAQGPLGPIRSAAIALGLAVLRLFAPLSIGFAVIWFVSSAAVLTPDGEALLVSIANGVIWAAGAYALAKLVYAPAAPRLRVIDIGDEAAARATRRLSLFAIVAALYDVIVGRLLLLDGDLAATTLIAAFLGIVAGPLLVSIAQTLSRPATPDAAPGEAREGEGEEEVEEFDLAASMLAVARLVLTVVGFALPIAAALGYASLARFLVVNTGLTLGVAAIGAVAYSALNRLAAHAGSSDTAQGPSGDAGPRWRFAALLIGFLIALLSAPAIGFIWGASEADLRSIGVGLIDGFEIGGERFTPIDVLLAIAAFLLGVWATRLVQGFLRRAVLPKTKLDSGARMSLVAGVGYIGFFLTALFAVSTAGLDLSNLAIVAGALSVGIGFGLQNIVNNFVSGLILLIERPIRVGDWIVVGDAQGYVRRINVRSTEIETFDRAAVIVPNSDLIANKVVNFTHRNLTGRVLIEVGVAYHSDPDQVIQILREACISHPRTLRYPEPLIMLARFGDSALEFEARVYLRDVNYTLSVKNDLNLAILKKLREAGVEIPFPQRDVNLRSVTPPPSPVEHLLEPE